ncbi:MAG: sodium-dependent transporter [Prevotella sp.]|jgi:NSS family neurotransmitter:Na+ symporter
MSERGNFGTKIGVILATVGSAVGLGNIWRFPYMTGQDGGAAFILIYLVCMLVLGIPGMVAEFVVGRHGASNAARAYYKMGGKVWSIVGYMGAITSMIILGFYAVIAGWCLQYLFAAIFGEISGDATYVSSYFKTFSSDPIRPLIWTIVFILITHMVVIRGVRRGIEKVSNVLMPTLFVLLLIIVVASCTLPGAGKGITFLFKPDFSKVTRRVFLDSLGQAFFSLSLGTACLCTYASYFSRQTNLLKSAGQIAFLDTMVAILAGLMIFPAAFSVGVSPDSGPSLIFITLPNVFQQAFNPTLGYIIGILFYALLSLAALTSTISMHEIGTAIFYEELHISRKKGAALETIIAVLIGIFSCLSCGAVDLTLFGKSFLDCCDYLTSNILMPFGSFLTCILIGWIVPSKMVKAEFTNWGTVPATLYQLWLFLIRFVSPLGIAAVFLHQMGII